MNRLRSLRKKNKNAVPEVPEVEAPEVPDVNEMKEAAADKAGDVQEMAADAMPGNMKWMMFKMWVVSKFSCCLGSPEMTKMGAVDVPEMPDAPEMPKIGGL